MALCTCASTVSGFTTSPQSMAAVTLCTLGAPFSSDTSATCAQTVPNDSTMAMPRARPAGSGEPQPAFSAARSSTFRKRGCFASSLRRSATGSCFEAAAISSIIVSITNAVCVVADRAPPQRRHRAASWCAARRSGWGCRSACRRRPRRDVPSMPSFTRSRLERRAAEDRLADDRVVPADDVALRVEPDLDAVQVHRAVVAAADVVLARPDDFTGTFTALRDLARLDDRSRRSGLARRPKPPPAIIVFSFTCSGLSPSTFAAAAWSTPWNLRAHPDLRAVGPHLHGAVERLHRRVGEERELVLGDDRLRRALDRLGVRGLLRDRAAGLLRASRGYSRAQLLAWRARRSRPAGPTRPRARRARSSPPSSSCRRPRRRW